MDKFAFLYHPYDLDSLYVKGIIEPSVRNKDRRFVERTLRWLPPIKTESTVITSKTGASVIGEMILVPLICDQIMNMEPKFVLDKTVKGAQLAENLGARIAGLGAYLSPVGRRGALVAKAVSIPVTSGTTYTIATAIDATIRAAEYAGLPIGEATVSIVGATGAIGRVCAQVLSEKVNKLILAARTMERLETLRREIIETNDVAGEILCNNDIKAAVGDSDIVVISTNTPLEILSARDFPPGCIVCDISVPHNISQEDALGSDVLIVDGGLVQPFSDVDFQYLGLPPKVAYACLSEVMLLALDGRFENFSTGGGISYGKVREIQRIADKHGFSLARFKSFGVAVTDEQIDRIRNARGCRKRRAS